MKKLVPVLMAFMFLTACQQVPIGGSPTAPSTPTVTFAPTITPTLGGAQTETYHYSTELAPGVTYGPPTLSESISIEGSGGSGRDGLLSQTDMTGADLVVYENAAYDGAAQSGYSKDQVEIVYLYDQTHLSWNMVLRLKTGEYLWSQRTSDGAYSTFPLQIPYDAASGAIQWGADQQLVVVAGSNGAESFYTQGGAVVLKGGQKVTIDGNTFFSQWFNTSTGQWEDIAEVRAALQASVPDYYPGPAQSLDQIPDLGSIEKIIELARYFASPAQKQNPVVSDTQLAGFGFQDLSSSEQAIFMCNYQGSNTCGVLATTRMGDHTYVIVQIATPSGPKNKLLYVGGVDIETERQVAQAALDRLNSTTGFSLHIMLRIKVLTKSNPLVYQWTVGPGEPLPDSSVQLKTGVITDETTPMWVQVVP